VDTLLATDRALLASLGALPRGYLAVALALTLTPWLTGTLAADLDALPRLHDPAARPVPHAPGRRPRQRHLADRDRRRGVPVGNADEKRGARR
jgi:hypothetical protein